MRVRVQVDRSVRPRVGRDIAGVLERALVRAGRRMGARTPELRGLGVRIVDDTVMRRLHARHLGEDRPTDVLSFPAAEAPPGSPGEPGLGDLVIDWDAVQRQAASTAPDDLLAEALSLAIHGLAHLLGHDHHAPGPARRMLRDESRAARSLGIAGLERPYGGRRR